jgi:copper chaperone CopZ
MDKLKKAYLDLKGANCASCVFTIEHLGRKVQGVTDIKVNTPNSEIMVEYEGNPGSLERIAEIVRKIGYDAKIRWESVS